MISRYSLPEMAELWSDQARYATWAKVEALASQAQALLGRVPERALAGIRRVRVPHPARLAELKRQRDHEILSFLAAVLLSAPAATEYHPRVGFTRHNSAWVLSPGDDSRVEVPA